MIAQAARAVAGKLRFERIDSFAAWRAHCADSDRRMRHIQRVEDELLSAPPPVVHDGWCHVCRAPSRFTVSSTNLREDLICARCRLINRLRAAVWLFERECRPSARSRIYLTEQVTVLYRVLAERYPGIHASEYLGDRVALGECADGIRNESVTQLTYETGSFSHLLSFEVLEHVPDYRQALRECARVLRPGGSMVLSAPFLPGAETTLVRARIGAGGELEHLLEPEYHGDPLSSDGCLCYHHFGWDLLADMRDAGFSRAWACVYWSRRFAYLGGEQIQFVAVR